MDNWIGRQLGPYELESRLGAGGMGVVYRATHRRLGQARAIKVLPTLLAHDETFLQRFEREAQLASELRHPNIVMIHDIAEENGVNYIVMELLAGRSLHEVIRQDGPLPADRAVTLLLQLADALDFAHQRGVVHRDIKPGNALVGEDDHLTLVDFGIAKAAEASRLTEVGTRVGTAEYMAPESITEGEAGPGTDLYALGIIAYEMLTGRAPFTGVNSQAILYAQIHKPPPPPHDYRADVSPGTEQVLLRQLDKDPSKRYSSGRAFVQALALAEGIAGSMSDRLSSRATGTLEVADRDATARNAVVTPPPVPRSDPAVRDPAVHAGSLDRTAILPEPTRPEVKTLSGTLPTQGQALPTQGRTLPTYGASPTPTPPPAVSTPIPSSRATLPPLPPPPASGDQRTALLSTEAPISVGTLVKLVFGGGVLLALLFCFLPTPREPNFMSIAASYTLPQGMGGQYMLGADALGRDVLSRLMIGGRFVLIRALIVAAILTGVALLRRRRAAKKGRATWFTTQHIILFVSFGTGGAIFTEFIVGMIGARILGERLDFLGPVGRILLGTPPETTAGHWGRMLSDGRAVVARAPWLALFPAAGLLSASIGIPLLGWGVVDLLRKWAPRSDTVPEALDPAPPAD